MSEEKKSLAYSEKTRLSVGSSYSPAVDDALAKRTWRKLDWHLLPVVSLLYLISFLCVIYLYLGSSSDAPLAGTELTSVRFAPVIARQFS